MLKKCSDGAASRFIVCSSLMMPVVRCKEASVACNILLGHQDRQRTTINVAAHVSTEPQTGDAYASHKNLNHAGRSNAFVPHGSPSLAIQTIDRDVDVLRQAAPMKIVVRAR